MTDFAGEVLLQALREVLPARPGLAVVHSSFASLAPPPGFRRYDAVYALDRLVREGWTVVVPAFSFSFCGGSTFDRRATPSEVGALSDWLLAGLPGALRTTHPIYSFVAAGPRAAEIAALEPDTSLGRGSPFELFEAAMTHIVMLGCSWAYCTQFHRYEELAAVPYRHFKIFEGMADLGAGASSISAEMYVRDLDLDPENDFGPAVARLREEGAIASAPLWRGRVEAVSARALAQVCRRQLAEDPFVYLANAAVVRAGLSRRLAREQEPPLRVAVLGHSNLEFLRKAVADSLAAHLPDRRVEAYAVPFGRLAQDVLAPDSELAAFEAEHAVFADRLEDLLGGPVDGIDSGGLSARVEEYAGLIARHAGSVRGWTLVCRFALTQPTCLEAGEALRRIDAMNAVLQDRLADLKQLAWIDTAHEIALVGAPVWDARLWHLGRFPFSSAFTARLAARITGLLLSASGRTARLIVLDLDNTLWGGVLGEDGLEGIRLGGDYPGNAYKALQRALKRLSKRGIALAVSSKNDSDLAIQAIETHPEMELRLADLAAHRINWQSKADGIAAIAEELGLGFGSILFVDDNPVEREAVRRALPDVKILDLPVDPAAYVDALLCSPWLSVVEVTDEDRKRAQSYKTRARIEAQRAKAVSLEDFYASLGMTLYVQPLDSGNLARAAQLCRKTNQFNTTARRYEATELQALATAGADVVVIGLSDRLSERENIGLLVLKDDEQNRAIGRVDLFLLSCRVLGRGIEGAVLAWAGQRALQRGWRELGGEIVETERNTPVRRIFADAGFTFDADRHLWRRGARAGESLPPWLAIADTMPAAARASEPVR